MRPRSRTTVPRRAARGLLAAAALSLAACVTEVESPPVVSLPPEAHRFERFLEATSQITADRVTVQALTAYKKDIGIITTSGGYHLRREEPDRLSIVNQAPRHGSDPVRITFRNMRIDARERIDVVFSDLPLLELQDGEDPVLVLFAAEGLARFRGDGVDLLADRIVVRNDEARAFAKDGRALTRDEATPPPATPRGGR
jgi:hypothetical protein